MLVRKLSHTLCSQAMVLGITVGEIEANNVHSCQDKALQHLGVIRGWSQCGDYFGSS